MSPADLHIRPGTLADKKAILSFTWNTFDWGDYLPKTWDRWVASRHGALLVGEVDGQVIGTIHVRLMEHREAWLEAVRVDPKWRAQGVATQLIEAGHRYARRHRCKVIRLETYAHNKPAHRTFEKLGYARVCEYIGFKAVAGSGNAASATDTDSDYRRSIESTHLVPLEEVAVLDNVRAATRADQPACWEMWERSALKRTTQGIVPSFYGWRWWEWTTDRFARAIRARNIWVTPASGTIRGWAYLRDDPDMFDLIMLIGTPRAAQALLRQGIGFAQVRNLPDVFWLTPKGKQASRLADKAGYALDEEGLLIHECAL